MLGNQSRRNSHLNRGQIIKLSVAFSVSFLVSCILLGSAAAEELVRAVPGENLIGVYLVNGIKDEKGRGHMPYSEMLEHVTYQALVD